MYRLVPRTLSNLRSKALNLNFHQSRNFWEYVNMMFNKPDYERREKYGPDRTCAEWVLRNGGSIVWENGKALKDYNLLPSEKDSVPQVMEIDGTDSSISHWGFEHMEGCNGLKKITLHKAAYIEDKAMENLSYCKNTVTDLQVSACKNITDDGLKKIVVVQNLKNLIVFDLTYVKDLNGCIKYLSSKLPNCKIQGNLRA